MKLLFLPGMGGNERLFKPYLSAFPGSEVVRWIPPKPRESLSDYARRLSHVLLERYGSEELVLVGFSFGGMVAYELAKHVKPKKLLMISSTTRSFATWKAAMLYGVYRSTVNFLPDRFLTFMGTRVAFPMVTWWENIPVHYQEELRRMILEADMAFLKWSIGAFLTWRPDRADDPCPRMHLHGKRDPVLRLPQNHEGYQVIEEGKHMILWAHAGEITSWIRGQLDQG